MPKMNDSVINDSVFGQSGDIPQQPRKKLNFFDSMDIQDAYIDFKPDSMIFPPNPQARIQQRRQELSKKWSNINKAWILLILHAIFIFFIFLTNFTIKNIQKRIITTILIFIFHFSLFFWCFIWFYFIPISCFMFFNYQGMFIGLNLPGGIIVPENIILNKVACWQLYDDKQLCYLIKKEPGKISLILILMIAIYFFISITILCIFGNYFLIQNPYIILSFFLFTLIFFILTMKKNNFMNKKYKQIDTQIF